MNTGCEEMPWNELSESSEDEGQEVIQAQSWHPPIVSLSPYKDLPTPSPADCKARYTIPIKPEPWWMRWITGRKPPWIIAGSPQGALKVASHRALGSTVGLILPSSWSSSSFSLPLPPQALRHLETILELLVEMPITYENISQKNSIEPCYRQCFKTFVSLKPIVITQRRHVGQFKATFPINTCWSNSHRPLLILIIIAWDITLRNSALRVLDGHCWFRYLPKNVEKDATKFIHLLKNRKMLPIYWLYIKNIFIQFIPCARSWVSINGLNRQGPSLHKSVCLGKQTIEQWMYNCKL